MAKKRTRTSIANRTLDARPDSLDFRDRMYVPTLEEVPTEISLDEYRAHGVPILDQGREGACTGFGLAAVANFLLRSRKHVPDTTSVSPRMFYEMAKRYDEWPGEEYAGSSARGAMKGWHKHGVCSVDSWPYRANREDRRLTTARMADARTRPLGAYFRVNHKDLVAMHSAISEVRILYATAFVHEGWERIGPDGAIDFPGDPLGGHAFAIVAFDRRGFWIQNSWGDDWGRGGFALITYDDWLENGTDVWVARLGAPIDLRSAKATAAVNADAASKAVAYSFYDIRPHVISIGNNGLLRETGTFATPESSVRIIFKEEFPEITAKWNKKRLLLYAHGGLTSEESATLRVAKYRVPLLENGVYPLAFVWKSDYWTTLQNILRDALNRRRPEGILDTTKDFMLDRLDDALEPLARQLTGKSEWDEMKENARLATESAKGGARIAFKYLERVLDDSKVELHVAGHSAGSIFLAPLVQYVTSKGKITGGPMKGKTGLGLKIASCTLWAPACTIELFKETYAPAIRSGAIGRFTLFTLTDAAEQDDHCANIYHKSLLYLVSNSFEEKARVPWIRDGVPILGMEKFVRADRDLLSLLKLKSSDWVLSPNTALDVSNRSGALRHGDFDDDPATLRATLARILQS